MLDPLFFPLFFTFLLLRLRAWRTVKWFPGLQASP